MPICPSKGFGMAKIVINYFSAGASALADAVLARGVLRARNPPSIHRPNPQTQISNPRQILDVLQPAPTIDNNAPTYATSPTRRGQFQEFPPRCSHHHNLRPRNTLPDGGSKKNRLPQFPPCIRHPRRIKSRNPKSPRSEFPPQ